MEGDILLKDHLDKIYTYEKYWINKELTGSQKEAIATNLDMLLKNANETYILYKFMIEDYIKKIKKSENTEEIKKLNDVCEKLCSESKNRFSMLFPTGMIKNETYRNFFDISGNSLFENIKDIQNKKDRNMKNDTQLTIENESPPRRTKKGGRISF